MAIHMQNSHTFTRTFTMFTLTLIHSLMHTHTPHF